MVDNVTGTMLLIQLGIMILWFWHVMQSKCLHRLSLGY